MNRNSIIALIIGVAISLLCASIDFLSSFVLVGCFLVYSRLGQIGALLAVGITLIAKLVLSTSGIVTETNSESQLFIGLGQIQFVLSLLGFVVLILLPKTWKTGTRIVVLLWTCSIIFLALNESGALNLMKDVQDGIKYFVQSVQGYTDPKALDALFKDESFKNLLIAGIAMGIIGNILFTIFIGKALSNVFLRVKNFGELIVRSQISRRFQWALVPLALSIVWVIFDSNQKIAIMTMFLLIGGMASLYFWQGFAFGLEFLRKSKKMDSFRIFIPVIIMVGILLMPLLVLLVLAILILGIVSYFLPKNQVDIRV